jgi:stage III sporulation protein AE
MLICLLSMLTVKANAMEFTAPSVPDSGRQWMPEEPESFGEGLMSILRDAGVLLRPSLYSAAESCLYLIGISVLLSVAKLFPGSPERVLELIGILCTASLLLKPSGSMIRLGAQTVKELSEYGKLLFPVLTAALAAQGGGATSAAIYAGTLAFDAILSMMIGQVIVPLIYIFLCLSVVHSATGQELLKKMKDFIKWLMTWGLKIVLYVFTGYMGVTGVVTGTTDAAALKATKLAISGMVPVVGGILADTSEAILVGAGVMKSAVGVYGLLAILAVWIEPFIRIGSMYLMLKIAFGLCGIFPSKGIASVIKDFSGAMGMLLAMTGTICLLLLVSVICYMKGVG